MATAQQVPPGQQPTPQQIAAMQQQQQQYIMAEAQKRGMTPQQFQLWQRQELEAQAKKAGLTFDQYINKLKQEAIANHQRQQQLAQQQQQVGQGGQSGQQVPINPGPPNPAALALAKWLQSRNLKCRTSLLNGQRKEMFRVKRALREIESPAYAAATKKKNSLLLPVTESNPSSEIFKLLPLSLLALRCSKADPHEGHDHAPAKKPGKRTKGLWTIKIEQQQDIAPDLHYIWLYEGSQWRTKLYAAGALAVIMAIVMFPLWPVKLRLGVYYLSMSVLGLIILFFAMALFRLFLFVITMFTVPPGLWLYPNLFEDVGFFDSFRPLWGWQEDKKAKKKAAKSAKSKGGKPATAEATEKPEKSAASSPLTTSTSTPNGPGSIQKRNLTPRVEEVEDGDTD